MLGLTCASERRSISSDSVAGLLSSSWTQATALLDNLVDAHLIEALPGGTYEYRHLVRLVGRRFADMEEYCREPDPKAGSGAVWSSRVAGKAPVRMVGPLKSA